MANYGQTDTAELVAMLSERAAVNVRLALVADAQQWQLHHGQVTLDDDTQMKEQAWRYSTASFLELRLPGPTVAALLQGEEQDVHGLQVVVSGPLSSSASTYRLRGQEEWGRVTTPWPRTEWTISRDANALEPGRDLLVGDGPSFLNFDQALSAFLHQRPQDSNARWPHRRVQTTHSAASQAPEESTSYISSPWGSRMSRSLRVIRNCLITGRWPNSWRARSGRSVTAFHASATTGL